MQTQQNDKPENHFGKFDSAAALLDAYNALEAEFTKRCQLVSKLQTELDSLRAQASEPTAPESDCAPVRSSADGVSIDAIAVAVEKDPEFALVLADIPEVCDACITKYKQRLLAFPAVSPHGSPVLAPTKKPRSLKDAKILVDEMIGG